MKISDKAFGVIIGIPSRGEFKQAMALSLIFLIHELTKKPYVEINGEAHRLLWYIHAVNTSNLSNSRQNIVDFVLQGNATHLLFLDDDMVFNQTIVHEWLAQTERHVIAANCPTRSIPCHPTARREGPTIAGTPIYSDVANMRFEKCWRIGTGIMMISREVLQKIKRPCFDVVWRPELDSYGGEDWSFVEEIQKAGYDVWIDHEQSLPIGHVGSQEFTHEMAAGTRMALARQASKIIVPDNAGQIEQHLKRA